MKGNVHLMGEIPIRKQIFSIVPITRIDKSRLSNTRSRSILHQSVLTTVAVAVVAETPASLYAQAKDALSVLDRNLIEAGTDKSCILMVMIYIPVIDTKPEFNRVWDEWVDRANLPLLDQFLSRGREALVADSRVRDFKHPLYSHLDILDACTWPDLAEPAEFRRVRLYPSVRLGSR